MPFVPVDVLPDDARLWVFASDRPVPDSAAGAMLDEVDVFLKHWHAHGDPLTASRDWRDEHFLAVALDQSTANASGCSIDGLYRSLRAVEPIIGTTLLGGGQIYYRDESGRVRCVDREQFAELAASGAITGATPVFDTTIATLGEWRDRFETTVARSWHAQLLPEVAR